MDDRFIELVGDALLGNDTGHAAADQTTDNTPPKAARSASSSEVPRVDPASFPASLAITDLAGYPYPRTEVPKSEASNLAKVSFLGSEDFLATAPSSQCEVAERRSAVYRYVMDLDGKRGDCLAAVHRSMTQDQDALARRSAAMNVELKLPEPPQIPAVASLGDSAVIAAEREYGWRLHLSGARSFYERLRRGAAEQHFGLLSPATWTADEQALRVSFFREDSRIDREVINVRRQHLNDVHDAEWLEELKELVPEEEVGWWWVLRGLKVHETRADSNGGCEPVPTCMPYSVVGFGHPVPNWALCGREEPQSPHHTPTREKEEEKGVLRTVLTTFF